MTESILPKFAVAIESKRDLILKHVDEGARKTELLRSCEEFLREYDKSKKDNLRRIIDHFLSKLNVSTADILEFLLKTNMANYLLDAKTEERERIENFDGEFGTTTSCILEQFDLPEEVTISRFNSCARYHPTPVSSMRQALDCIGSHLSDYKDFVFIDVGSGMGRNLMISSSYPFKKLIGVEISSYLNNVAESNLKKFLSSNRRCGDYELQCIDARLFQFPDENLLLYFWEPFGPDVAKEFVNNLDNALVKSRKKVFLIFLRGVFDAVANSSKFVKIEVVKTDDFISISENECFELSIYKYVPT